jgi:glycosyltransferase involved in cell wall biosynthesis
MNGIPKVSVVIPTYQRASFLRETIEDLLDQTLKDIDVIVADDGSTDRTPEVVASFRDPRVLYLRRKHMGMPLILNEGFAVARGEYVMTCHDHDIYDPTLLTELAGALDRHPTAVYAHCGVIVVDASGNQELERYVRDYPEVNSGNLFLADELLPGLDSPVTAITMVRRAVRGGIFLNPTFGEVADVELWLRLSTVGDVAYVKKPLIRVRKRDSSSHFYHCGCRLAAHTLEAKRGYLAWVEDGSRRGVIQMGWRKDSNRTGFSELLRALDARRYHETPFIAEYVRKEGTLTGARALLLLCRMPPAMALGVLRLLRLLSRPFRVLIH